MRLILSHRSALEFWMSGAMLGSVSVSRSKLQAHVLPATFGAAVSSVEIKELLDRYPLSLPIHTLVSSANHLDNRPGCLKTHVWSSSSTLDCFYRLSPDLYVCSPELVYLQMASSMTLLEMIKLGFDLCGTYRFGREKPEYQQEPLTTVKRLRAVVECHRGKRGRPNALRALEFVRDGSGSPRETALAMLLGLPCRLGGAGFGMPNMNYSIQLGVESRVISSKQSCVCDLYFADFKVDIEYESYEFHSGPRKMEQDSLRRDALALMGINVITVTNKQVADLEMLNALIKLVSKALKRRFRIQNDNFFERQKTLQTLVIH